MRLAALVIACLALAGCGGDDGGGSSRAETSTGAETSGCEKGAARTAEELTGDLPSGWTTAAAPRETIEDFRKQLATADEGEVVQLTGRQIRRRGEPVAVVIVIESDEPAELEEIVDGAEDGSGKKARPAPFGDDPEAGRIITANDGGASLFGVPDTCSALILLATSPALAEQVSRALSV